MYVPIFISKITIAIKVGVTKAILSKRDTSTGIKQMFRYVYMYMRI